MHLVSRSSMSNQNTYLSARRSRNACKQVVVQRTQAATPVEKLIAQ